MEVGKLGNVVDGGGHLNPGCCVKFRVGWEKPYSGIDSFSLGSISVTW